MRLHPPLHGTTGSARDSKGWERRQRTREGGGRAAFAAARWPSFGLNCSVYYPCGISNYLFLLDRPLARMTLISLAARLHTFNWCVTSRQLSSFSLSLSLLSISFALSTWRVRLRGATMPCRSDFMIRRTYAISVLTERVLRVSSL